MKLPSMEPVPALGGAPGLLGLLSRPVFTIKMSAAALLLGAVAVWGDVSSVRDDVIGRSLAILAAVYTVALFLAAEELAGVRAGLVRMLSRIETE